MLLTPGMKGKVISLHDDFHLDVVQGEAIPPKAIVQFESGMRLMVDERMQWERDAWLTREGIMPASNSGCSVVTTPKPA